MRKISFFIYHSTKSALEKIVKRKYERGSEPPTITNRVRILEHCAVFGRPLLSDAGLNELGLN